MPYQKVYLCSQHPDPKRRGTVETIYYPPTNRREWLNDRFPVTMRVIFWMLVPLVLLVAVPIAIPVVTFQHLREKHNRRKPSS